MKVLVPPAPIPVRVEESKSTHERLGLIEAFDDGFVGRIIASMLGFGALLMLGVLGATNSPSMSASFLGGIVLGALLLKSQELFVRRVLGPRVAQEKNLCHRVPLAVILPLKYLFIGAILGIIIEAGWLSTPALTLGFVVSQFVIVAKVVGRFASLKRHS